MFVAHFVSRFKTNVVMNRYGALAVVIVCKMRRRWNSDEPIDFNIDNNVINQEMVPIDDEQLQLGDYDSANSKQTKRKHLSDDAKSLVNTLYKN
nr:PREDICTED: uncharacterized protein LOC103314574 isoform X2 [Tribolium castaneum]|eukprot:XP_015837819.1 PREDICTED: uncharacterized protein LOC103314574 isoform X2 [Tribolium castaneum]